MHRQPDATNETGFVDLGINYAFSFTQQKPIGKSFSMDLDGGLGISFPVGKYDSKIHYRDLPENFNPGNGSFGISVAHNSKSMHGYFHSNMPILSINNIQTQK
ncbi:MAG: hypothetical protein M3R25_07850 [Bacteroidota bacterium]|nr:hypothetical protein [Bacteroidota bacterium]